MLAGILYCAHCGSKLVGAYCTKQLEARAYHRPVYRCYTKANKAKHCEGQYVYSAKKIETIVLQALNEYFLNVLQNVDSEWREKARAFFVNRVSEKQQQLEAQLPELEAEEQMLKDEAIKSLHGQSQYDRDLLSQMFAKNREAVESCITEINRCKTDLAAAESQMRYLTEQYKYVKDWADKLQYAPDDLKKLIIARFIDRITVDRNYKITIYFYISSDSFQFEVVEKNGNVVIEMTDRPLVKVVE